MVLHRELLLADLSVCYTIAQRYYFTSLDSRGSYDCQSPMFVDSTYRIAAVSTKDSFETSRQRFAHVVFL